MASRSRRKAGVILKYPAVNVHVLGWKGGLARCVRILVRAGSSVEVCNRGTSDMTGYTVVFDPTDVCAGELRGVRRRERCSAADFLNSEGDIRGEGEGLEDGQVMV